MSDPLWCFFENVPRGLPPHQSSSEDAKERTKTIVSIQAAREYRGMGPLRARKQRNPFSRHEARLFRCHLSLRGRSGPARAIHVGPLSPESFPSPSLPPSLFPSPARAFTWQPETRLRCRPSWSAPPDTSAFLVPLPNSRAFSARPCNRPLGFARTLPPCKGLAAASDRAGDSSLQAARASSCSHSQLAAFSSFAHSAKALGRWRHTPGAPIRGPAAAAAASGGARTVSPGELIRQTRRGRSISYRLLVSASPRRKIVPRASVHRQRMVLATDLDGDLD